MWLPVGSPWSWGWSYTHVYMSSTNCTQWVMGEKRKNSCEGRLCLLGKETPNHPDFSPHCNPDKPLGPRASCFSLLPYQAMCSLRHSSGPKPHAFSWPVLNVRCSGESCCYNTSLHSSHLERGAWQTVNTLSRGSQTLVPPKVNEKSKGRNRSCLENQC